MNIVTRFAPSPTGFLHIGGARTALFNWLFARANKGNFLLRIEDTDRERSTPEAVEAIHAGMKWLGLDADGEVIQQFIRAPRHAEVAHQLVKDGKAYYCYCSPEELTAMRERAKETGGRIGYDRTWRDRDPSEAPAGVKPVVRIKAPLEGEMVIQDLVQGEVRVKHEELDDLVLLRADGTPTYMLAVIVDDHDMGVTHIIRGDDHLNNAFRQKVIYDALNWLTPEFAHIPLIHGADGAKLSKRHGALGVEAYRDMGFLPEAMRNYLLRLGWSHGDDEIITTEQAIEWFNIENIGRAPARFDTKKLESINGHYMRESSADHLLTHALPFIEKKLNQSLPSTGKERLLKAMDLLKQRAKTLIELADSAIFLVTDVSLPLTDQAKKALETNGHLLKDLIALCEAETDWNRDALEAKIKTFAESQNMGMGIPAGVLRACLTYSHVSPSVFDIMVVLGREESLRRMKA